MKALILAVILAACSAGCGGDAPEAPCNPPASIGDGIDLRYLEDGERECWSDCVGLCECCMYDGRDDGYYCFAVLCSSDCWLEAYEVDGGCIRDPSAY